MSMTVITQHLTTGFDSEKHHHSNEVPLWNGINPHTVWNGINPHTLYGTESIPTLYGTAPHCMEDHTLLYTLL